MLIQIFDPDHSLFDVVDITNSFIWTERYNDVGDFELIVPLSAKALSVFQHDYLIEIPNSNRTMIIESTELRSNVETGKTYVVKGRSLESILDRRVITTQFVQGDAGAFLNIVEGLVDSHFINDSVTTNRNISNLAINYTSDTYLQGLTLNCVLFGGYVLDEIVKACKSEDIGFKILWSEGNQRFEYEVYVGIDRSYEQTTNPWVVFSESFDNLLSASFLKSTKFYKNIGWTVGDATNATYHSVTTTLNDATTEEQTGLSRKEFFLDCFNVSHFKEDGTTISASNYHAKLRNKLKMEAEIKAKLLEEFSAQAETNLQFAYNVDFFLGDIVQFEDEYGHVLASRVTEITFAEGPDGLYTFPTFESI